MQSLLDLCAEKVAIMMHTRKIPRKSLLSLPEEMKRAVRKVVVCRVCYKPTNNWCYSRQQLFIIHGKQGTRSNIRESNPVCMTCINKGKV